MFSGIVRAKGRVTALGKGARVWRLRVRVPKKLGAIGIGDSLSVSGACLTVSARGAGGLVFDLVPETLRRTHFRLLKPGDTVNLEPSLRYGERMHGHPVSGHVEAAGRLEKTEGDSRSATWTVSFPPKLRPRITPKGSIALEGVSLTVGRVTGRAFRVHLVPHTLKTTNLGAKKKGDPLNLETERR